jgi:hypothetical protein
MWSHEWGMNDTVTGTGDAGIVIITLIVIVGFLLYLNYKKGGEK